jgi:hypothetical protein
VLLIILLNIAPLLLLGVAWWFYRHEAASLANWRRGVFVSAFVANAVSAAVLVSFIAQVYIASKGTKPVDLDKVYPVFSMLGIGLLAAILAVSGRRVSRLVLIGDGLLTASSGTSPQWVLVLDSLCIGAVGVLSGAALLRLTLHPGAVPTGARGGCLRHWK